MDFSTVKSDSEELNETIVSIIDNHPGDEHEKKLIAALTMYVVSNNLDLRSSYYEEDQRSLMVLREELKEIVTDTFDYLDLLLSHPDFSYFDGKGIDFELKKELFKVLKAKIEQGTLNEENYLEFVEYFQQSFKIGIVMEMLRKRISSNRKNLEEFKAVLEYMTLLGRTYFEHDELDRLQESVNFRLNRLEHYSPEYFAKHFFLLKSRNKQLMEDMVSARYYYPKGVFKELKNLVLAIERGEAESTHLEVEAKDIIDRQLKMIKENQEKIRNLN